jgi:hypothetical protein
MNAPWKKITPAQAGVDREIDELAAIKAQLSPLNKAEKKLVEAMRERYQTDGLYAGTNVMLVRSTTSPNTFDKDAFEADHPELYASYLRPKDRTVFAIKPKG